MTRKRTESEAILLRHLLGEIPAVERADLERRLAEEPALARELAALKRSWIGLELPPTSPVPPGFATRVAARARPSREADVGPLRLRWAAAVALALGIALGTTISAGLSLPTVGDEESEVAEADATLAESYLDAAADSAIGGYLLDSAEEGGERDPEAEGTPR